MQLAVVKHANTPTAALEYLGGHIKSTSLKAVIENLATLPAILERLAEHRNNNVWFLARSMLEELRITSPSSARRILRGMIAWRMQAQTP